jgi:AraC-like DNA-binding protein
VPSEPEVVELGTTTIVTGGLPGTVPGVDGEIDLALAGTGGERDQVLIVLSAPHDGARPAGATAPALRIALDDLAVSAETVRIAAGRIRASPLHPLVRNHVSHLLVEAPTLPPAAAAALDATTVHLVRALILSAAGAAPAPGEPHQASTAARIQAYVAAHLRDPDLGPARIAAANAVSTRTLYKIYEALGTSLGRSILDQRLQGARTDLASPGRRHQSIAAIARSWGFANPSSFAQQFRRAFGSTPRRYRAERLHGSGP